MNSYCHVSHLLNVWLFFVVKLFYFGPFVFYTFEKLKVMIIFYILFTSSLNNIYYNDNNSMF